LAEDVGDGDHSTLSVIPNNAKGKAVLKIKEKGVLAGMTVAEKIFKFIQPDVEFVAFKKDGDDMVFNLDRAIQSTRLETILR
jgi:nicotinate-nucleotide pyrophosphorylase (carboxylating)